MLCCSITRLAGSFRVVFTAEARRKGKSKAQPQMNADQRRGEKLKTWFSQNPDTFGENPGPFNRTTLQKINEGRFHPAGSWPSIPEGLVAGFASRLRRSPDPEGPSTPECKLRQELDRRFACWCGLR